MPKFSKYFRLNASQYQLDFVDISNEYDTQVYVDPYAIEISDDVWAEKASGYIRTFFQEVLESLRKGDKERASDLMSHLHEPRETFLGVSSATPQGRGVGSRQSNELIKSIARSKAFQTGILEDLSEMALYVDGVDRDKISDLTTNIIRDVLINYTKQQCDLYGIETHDYNGPPIWDNSIKNWRSKIVKLPYIDKDPIILVPKYIVRRHLSLNSQEFYTKQITDFLVMEAKRSTSSLVRAIKGGKKERIITKTEVREKNPKSKTLIADLVSAHPELLKIYKDIAKKYPSIVTFDDESGSITATCESLTELLLRIPKGSAAASDYHSAVLGILTALFYPNLIQPHKEWEIYEGRKRIDIVFTNAAKDGFFSQRRDDQNMNAQMVIVECKNYSDDIANPEIDQLLGRFDDNRGKFGIITCREVDNTDLLQKRCKDIAASRRGYIIILTDADLTNMLKHKGNLKEHLIDEILYKKLRSLF